MAASRIAACDRRRHELCRDKALWPAPVVRSCRRVSLFRMPAILGLRRSFFQLIVGIVYIRSMNLNSLDLNLLVALDALLREASVSRAAMRIGLSQPAASHALQRLRELIGDPLLVRTGARMELTLRAQGLRGPLTQSLEQERGLFTRDEFDAARSERHFRLMMPDLAVELLVPPLMEKVTKLAPNVTIDVVPWR